MSGKGDVQVATLYCSCGQQPQRLKQALEHLRQALEHLRQALEETESVLRESDETFFEEEEMHAQRTPERSGQDLFSVMEVSQELGMGKTWVHRKIKSGEIPSIRLGNNIKVRRKDLEEYLESSRLHPPGRRRVFEKTSSRK
jgi:excisionase family DNA binding protein